MKWTEHIVINLLAWALSCVTIWIALFLTRNPTMMYYLGVPAFVTIMTSARALDWLDNVVAAVVERIEGKKEEVKADV